MNMADEITLLIELNSSRSKSEQVTINFRGILGVVIGDSLLTANETEQLQVIEAANTALTYLLPLPLVIAMPFVSKWLRTIKYRSNNNGQSN